VVTPAVVKEIENLSWTCAGYFVKAKYSWQDKILNYGLQNNKLVLFNRNKVEFPIIDDLKIQGMGEMEGHYQPVLKDKSECLGQLKSAMLHHAYDDEVGWHKRHECYAAWEAEMVRRDAYPKDPSILRETIKRVFRKAPLRGLIAFLHSYIIKLGLLDGKAGLAFARSRARYYQMVAKNLRSFRESSNKAAG
jgi:hypothetical protein